MENVISLHPPFLFLRFPSLITLFSFFLLLSSSLSMFDFLLHFFFHGVSLLKTVEFRSI